MPGFQFPVCQGETLSSTTPSKIIFTLIHEVFLVIYKLLSVVLQTASRSMMFLSITELFLQYIVMFMYVLISEFDVSSHWGQYASKPQ